MGPNALSLIRRGKASDVRVFDDFQLMLLVLVNCMILGLTWLFLGLSSIMIQLWGVNDPIRLLEAPVTGQKGDLQKRSKAVGGSCRDSAMREVNSVESVDMRDM